MNIIRTSALVFAFAASPIAAQAASLDLLAAVEGDHTPSRLTSAKRVSVAPLDREPASFAWALDPSQPIEKAKPFVAESREYWTRVSARELAAGVVVHTTAEGAVLRLSQIAGATKRVFDLQALELRYAGRTLRGTDAVEQFANAGQLKAAGLGFPENTVAFRLKPELGAGDFELALPQAGGDFLLHVFEPKSGERVTLSADRAVVLHGDDLALEARFESQQGKRLGELVGTIAAPNGRLFDLRFESLADGRWQARARIDAETGASDGLWEVHATAVSSDGLVQRDVRTAFDAVAPGARLGGRADVALAKGGALRVSLPIDVASPSRYNVSGLLYGSDADGQLRPFAIAHTAAWAEPGETTLSLQFAPELLATSALHPPFELRNVELTDFANRSVIERRERALRFTPN